MISTLTGCSLLMASPLWADSYFWNVPAGDWGTPASWRSFVTGDPGVPTLGDNASISSGAASINDGSAYAVSAFSIGSNAGAGSLDILDGSLTVDDLFILGLTDGGDAGTLTISGSNAALIIEDTTRFMRIGSAANGALTLADNAMLDSVIDVQVARSAGVSGVLNINSGAVLLTPNVTAGDGDATLNFDGGILRLRANQADLFDGFGAGGINLLAGGARIDTNGFDASSSAALSGVGGLTKDGSGTLILNGLNSFAGHTSVTNGVLVVGNAAALGSNSAGLFIQSVGNAVVVDLGGFTVTKGQVILNGQPGTQIRNGTLVRTGLFQLGNGNVNAVLAGSGSLHKVGSLVGVLSAVNTYTGATEVLSNTLRIDATGSILNTSGITINGGTLSVNGAGGNAIADTLDITHTTGNLLLVGSDETIGSISGAGAIDLNGQTLITGNAANQALSGVISGTAGGLTKQGTGTLTLSGANTYTGATTINAGTVAADHVSALGDNSAVTVNAAGTLDLASSLGIGSLAGAGNINLSASGANTLSTGGDNTSTIFSGLLSGVGGALTKTGTGTFTLTSANSYSGGTTISAGTLVANNAGGSATGSGAVTVANGGALGGSGFITGTVTLHDGAILAPGNSPGTLTLGELVLSDTSVLDFELGAPTGTPGLDSDLIDVVANLNSSGSNGNLTLDGILNVTDLGGFTSNGSHRLISYDGVLTNNGLTLGTGFLAGYNYAVDTTTSGQVGLVVDYTGLQHWDGNGSASDGLVTGGSGTWNAGAGNWTNNNGTVNTPWADLTAVFDGASGTVEVDGSHGIAGLQFVTDGYRLEDADANGALVLAASGADLRANAGISATLDVDLSGSGTLTKTGAGTIILSGANSYSGGTTISDGVLQGTTASLQGDITNNATLVFDQAANGTYAGTISGSGSLTKSNAGTLTLSGANSYSGGTTISAGVLQGTTASLQGDITNNATLVFDQATNGIHTGTISGSGSLTKSNAGTLTLSGANSYSGGTTISAGVLQGATASLQGDITNNATLVFDQAANGTHTGMIGGSGSLTKSNAGTLTLSGANSYSGGTTISDGVLQGTTASLQGDITNNATLVFDQAANGTYAGTISGSGSLTKSNAGTLTLSGANSYSGGTTISDGVLQGATASLQGDITNNATLVFDQAANGIYAGTISGSGSLTKSNAGTLTLSGANSYSGGTTVSGGTLQGSTTSLQGSISNNAMVNFDQATDGVYAGMMSGTGSLTKSGAGTLTFSGINSYSGSTTINSGIFAVNGSIANSATTLNTGGTLGGNGTVGSVTLNGGTLAPGNSIGTLNVAGDVNFSGGGVYQVEVDAAGNSDRINATGSATLTNGTVLVLPEAGDYKVSTDYSILTAAGGLGGTTFNSVSSTLAFLTPTLSYDANTVFLNLRRNSSDYASVADTANQGSVGTALDTLVSSGATGVDDLFNNLNILTADGANQAFDSLSGVQHTYSNLIALQSLNQFKGLLFDRLQGNNQFLATNGQLMLAYNDSGTMSDAGSQLLGGQPATDRGWWLRGTGSYGEIDGTRNASGAHYNASGTATGIDFNLDDSLTLGAAFGYSRTNADVAQGGLEVDSYQAALYGRWLLADDYYASGIAGLGYHDIDASRRVNVGLSSNTAKADYDAWTGNVAIEGGRKLALNANTSLTPLAGLEYAHINRASFTEKGAGAADLHVGSDQQDSLRSALGARLEHSWTTRNGNRIQPTVELAWVHEFMDNEAALRAGFAPAPNASFSVSGPELDRDRARLSLGLNMQVTETAYLNLGYQGEIAGSDDRHDISATFRMAW